MHTFSSQKRRLKLLLRCRNELNLNRKALYFLKMEEELMTSREINEECEITIQD